MNCRQARTEIALLVGHDLDEASVAALRRHVAQCPDCHKHWHQVKSGWQALEAFRNAEPPAQHDSVWPEVSSTLAKFPQPASPGRTYQAWVPVVAVAAIALAMVSLVDTFRDMSSSGSSDWTAHDPRMLPVGAGQFPSFVPGPGLSSSPFSAGNPAWNPDNLPWSPPIAERDAKQPQKNSPPRPSPADVQLINDPHF